MDTEKQAGESSRSAVLLNSFVFQQLTFSFYIIYFFENRLISYDFRHVM